MELVCTLRVEYAVLVSQLNQHVHGGTSGQVRVMHCWFWHHLEALVKIRVDQLRQHRVVLIGKQRVVIRNHLLAQVAQFLIDNCSLV